MAHELDFSRGEAAIAYRGEMPWHGFGNVEAPDENWTLDTWLEKASLDFTYERAPAIYMVPDLKNPGQMIEKSFDGKEMVYRSDTQEALSVMSDKYVPRQPREILGAFNEMIAKGGARMEVAGALQGGKKIWALVRLDRDAGSIGADIIKPYVLLLDSVDGTHATTARLTSVRVVCANTVAYSEYKDGATTAKGRHSGEFNANKLFAKLGEYDAAFDAFMSHLTAFSKVKMTDSMIARFFSRIYMPDCFEDADNWQRSPIDYDREGVTTNQRNTVAALLDAYRDNPGASLPSSDGTLFGAFQTVTYFQDHAARTKENKRWESATIGQGNRIKQDAFDLAMNVIS